MNKNVHNRFAAAMINLYFNTFGCLPGKVPSRVIAESAKGSIQDAFCARWTSPEELIVVTPRMPEYVFPDLADDFVLFLKEDDHV